MIIKTSTQLKDKISNISGNNSKKAQILIRKYMMEQFLVRISKTKYRNNFILKGGMLISAIVGVEVRTTMDIDTTVRRIPLTKDRIINVIGEIIKININDGLNYEIRRVEDIMEEHDYTGIRLTLDVKLEKLRDTIKIDISTGDEITPSAIEFSYPMMFDAGKIDIWSYNIETLLAEKLETIVVRSTFNTRMRDFYDVYLLWNDKIEVINRNVLYEAFINTANKRGTIHLLNNIEEVIENIVGSDYLRENWENYKKNNSYVGDLTWDIVLGKLVYILRNELKVLSVSA